MEVSDSANCELTHQLVEGTLPRIYELWIETYANTYTAPTTILSK